MSNFVGLLTAVKNTAIPMTVIAVYEDGTQIETSYIVNGELKRFTADADSFIGFGDTLVYSDGAFVDAYFANVSDDDDDEDDEDDDEDEDREPGDHDDLKN